MRKYNFFAYKKQRKKWLIIFFVVFWDDGDFHWIASPARGASRDLLCIWDTKCFKLRIHFVNERFVGVEGMRKEKSQ